MGSIQLTVTSLQLSVSSGIQLQFQVVGGERFLNFFYSFIIKKLGILSNPQFSSLHYPAKLSWSHHWRCRLGSRFGLWSRCPE